MTTITLPLPEAARRVLDMLTGKLRHRYTGDCPSPSNPDATDPDCSACHAITVLRAALEQPQPMTMEQSVAVVQVCCGKYATCHRPCTPRGSWLATRALEQPQRKKQCMNCAAFGECHPNNDARNCGYEPEEDEQPQSAHIALPPEWLKPGAIVPVDVATTGLLADAQSTLTGAANYIDTLGGVSQGYRQFIAKIDAMGEGERG